MFPHLDITLPFQDPVLVFALVLLIIFFAPILLKKLHIPGMVVLILAGIAVGPHGFYLISRNSSIELFGTVGLLYIMFTAGLEIDLDEFKKNRHKSLIFGALTFSFPLILGFLATHYFLNLPLPGAILLASMFSTHTLVAYPVVSRLGLMRNSGVTMTVGGTIITDTAVLLVLAVISSMVQGNADVATWIRMAVTLAVFVSVVMWGFPRIGTWFFRNVEEEGGAQYIFVLALVFLASFFARVAGVEPIIGAFLAGLALNRLVPQSSSLMNRINFVGNTLFVPFFLISVGMIVDPRILASGPQALIVAATLIIVAFSGKWLAAIVTQRVFHYSALERKVIFGLSSAHAAATLAIVLVGYNLQLFDVAILNGTIILILVSCLVSSFVVEHAGRRLAIIEEEKTPPAGSLPARILIPIANESTVDQLVDLALMIKEARSAEPLFVLTVIRDDEEAQEKVLRSNRMLDQASKRAAASDNAVQAVSRIDLNVASGIVRATKEMMITKIILGWNARITRGERIFGRVVDNLVAGTDKMILVSKLIYPLNTTKRLVVAVPPNAEHEQGFVQWVTDIGNLGRQTGSTISVYGTEHTWKFMEPLLTATWTAFDAWDEFSNLAKDVTAHDLLIVVSARGGTISYKRSFDRIPRFLSRYFQELSFVIVYPEQYPVRWQGRV